MTGRIFSINTSVQKGVPKDIVKAAVLREHFGLVGDAHAGVAERQISLLGIEDIEKAESDYKGSDIDFRPGLFAENITTVGIDLAKLKVGDKLAIGDQAVLIISQIGKTCHSGCAIGQKVGQCIMPKQGIFAFVEKGGEIKVRDEIRPVTR